MESMDEKGGDAGGHKEQTVDETGAAIPLRFADSSSSLPPLAPLRDSHSNYAAVAKACSQLNQFALNGSNTALEDDRTLPQSQLFHDSTMASSLSDAIAALTECLQNHSDRQARIISATTLATMARSYYAKLRVSPHMFALRDGRHTRMEDEVGTDVPMALVSAALDDSDDGVAVTALHALGMLVLSSGAIPATLVDDELSREIASFVQQRPSAYAPTLEQLEDEPSYVPQVELQTRILQNVIGPRLMQLIWRLLAVESNQGQYWTMVLPVLTASLVYLSKTSITLYALDRETYAKRWVEVDYVHLIDLVVQQLLLPSMQSSSPSLAHAAAMSSIRLLHASPQASWVDEVVHWVTLVLREDLTSASMVSSLSSTPAATPLTLEAQLSTLAALLIVSRAVPFPARSSILLLCFERIRGLPCTTMAPYGVSTAGLLLQVGGVKQYRRPARVAFLAELALSFFMDGPVTVSSETKYPRSYALENFIKSNEFGTASKEVQNGKAIQLREELALAFCMVAVEVGRRHKDAPEYSSELLASGTAPYELAVSKEDFAEWARMALMVLSVFNSCVSWDPPFASTYMEEDLSLSIAAQASYTRLAQEMTHAVGLLPSPSVSLQMAPTSCPPHLLWDTLEESAYFLSQYSNNPFSSSSLLDKVGKMMESFVKKDLKGSGIGNHHLRHHLLVLAADQWVQARFVATRKEMEGKGSSTGLNASAGIELLQALSPRRIFTRVVDNHKSQIEAYDKKKKELYRKYSQDTVTVCVACVENIALATSDWRRRFGNSAEVKSLYDAAMASLLGKTGQGDTDVPVLPVCQSAIERVQAAFGTNDKLSSSQQSFSPLVMKAKELERRPEITPDRVPVSQDGYFESYLMLLSRQIVLNRIDRCIFSYPVVASLEGSARKQNWLRLALSPLPPSRNPKISLESLPKFAWGSNVSAPAGGSDASAMVLAYSIRRGMRYDGEDAFYLTLMLRVHNLTAVEVPGGLRLNLSVHQESSSASRDGQDEVSKDIRKSLSSDKIGFNDESTMCSAVAVYKPVLESGEHLTWEVSVDPMPMTGALALLPSIEYRGMEDEVVHAAWVGPDSKEGDRDDTSAMSGVSQQSLVSKTDSEDKENEQKLNVTIPGESMKLPALVGLQPSPFVFFRDGCGDIGAFRFQWARFPYQTPPISIEADPDSDSNPSAHVAVRLAALASLKFNGSIVPGGEITRAWAFTSLTGQNASVVLAEADGDGDAPQLNLHVRSDDKHVICCLTGTSTARVSLVESLLPGCVPL
eukprot:Nitzschia sp. Nitz4//scaffold11_size288233//19887//23690//NITZ4_000732-RA/size288233-processed-gene-0.137-mRNA-1//1//CDS//3329533948//6199//frame0